MSYSKLVLGTVFTGFIGGSAVLAADTGFVTIIGPDGFPLVVPHPEPNKIRGNSESKKSTPVAIAEPKKQQSANLEIATIDVTQKQDVILANNGEKDLLTPKNIVTDTTADTVQTEDKAQAQQNTSVTNIATAKAVAPAQPKESLSEPFRIIDGEKYYEAEYLESKEFNLEEKKRFYQIPGQVGGNWDVIEREKGADMSWFRVTQQQNKPQETIVLGKDYKVLSKAQLSDVLPLQCVDAKAQRKAKSLSVEKPLSLWSRPSLDGSFDYQLVLLGTPSIQNIKLSSYANQTNNPTYYWPMAVFLDEQGCIVEGASAFYTQAYPMTMLQNASIEGVVHIPKNSKYILLTALEYAVDLPDFKLSHQGQIKLTVLR